MGAASAPFSLGGNKPVRRGNQRAVDYAGEHQVIVAASAGGSAERAVNGPANRTGALAVGGVADSSHSHP